MAASSSQLEAGGAAPIRPVWYRSTIFAAFILGVCNFGAPGVWGAMASLGAGGRQSPYLVNAANALTFCLMIFTAFLAPSITRLVGVKFALFLGGIGYAPYAAGLYCNSVYGTNWLILFGATTCGLGAGLFWAVEAAVAISYPEPYRVGKCIGIWLSFRVAGSVVGGAINLGIAHNQNYAGSINPKVYLVFIALQAAGPFAAFLLPSPTQLQRTDGRTAQLYVNTTLVQEVKATAKVFFKPRYLLIVPLIVQAVFPESYTNTYLAAHFTVRSRALGSLVSACGSVIVGNVLGRYLDWVGLSLKTKARWAFIVILTLQGGWWIWSTVIQSNFPSEDAVDWSSSLFGRTFALYVFLSANFQANYMFLYFVCQNLTTEPQDVIRIAGLLRATESAAQAVAYGTNSIESFKLIGSSSLNFGLWGLALIPAWLVIRRIGVDYIGVGALQLAEAEDSELGDDSGLSTPRSNDYKVNSSDGDEKF